MIPFPAVMNAYLKIKSRGFLARLRVRVTEINKFIDQYQTTPDDRLLADFEEIRADVRLNMMKPEMIEVPLFAVLREIARRTVDMFPYDVQILAALVLRRNKIIQMATGEGKTLVAPFHAIMETLYGRQVVIVSPNDYLSYRDANWMGPLYEAVGVSVATVQPWYSDEEKYRAYQADVIYASTERVVFDYLEKHHAIFASSDFPIPLKTVIIDEVDNVLLDQGSKPYALVSPVNFQSEHFSTADRFVDRFTEDFDFTAAPKLKELEFTPSGLEKLAQLRLETPIPYAELIFYLKCALSAYHLYEKNKDYIVEDDHVVLVDSFTGRPAYGSSFTFGIHQAIEEKEKLPLSFPNTTINQITLQAFFSQFNSLAGMSGSAVHNALEFKLLYKLDVIPIPSNTPSIRQDFQELIFGTKTEQINEVVEMTDGVVKTGRPVLIGTINIEDAESVAARCSLKGFDYRLLTAKNHFDEAQIIAEAGQGGRVTIAALMAGRGVDIKLDDEARRAGGLYIIGVGRNENRRLDEQLQGRAGRQGDPGSCVFILSLEDDLLKIWAGDRLRKLLKTFGLVEGRVIESPMVSRRLKGAQKQLVYHRFYERQTAMLFDNELAKARQIVFSKREAIVVLADYEYETDAVITRYSNRVSACKNAELTDKLHEMSYRFHINLPPRIWHLTKNGDGTFAEELKQSLRKFYMSRCEETLYAQARKRLILLRSIDYCWSLFIDESWKIFDDLRFGGKITSRLQTINEIARRMWGTNEKLLHEIDSISLLYLMHIHDEGMLREIKYWRGMGGYNSEGLDGDGNVDDDGISPPEAYLSIYLDGTEDQSTIPKILPKSLPPMSKVGLHRFSEYLRDYLTNLSLAKTPEKDLQRIKAILEQYQRYLHNDDISPLQALNTLPRYLGSLKTQGIGYFSRAKQRKVIVGLFAYLQKHKIIPGQASNNLRQTIKRKAIELFSPMMNPVFILQLLLLAAIFLAYRYIATVPIPFLAPDNSNPLLRLPFPPLALRLVDELLLAGALTKVGIGILGIIPFLMMRLLAKLVNTEWRFESPILYLPVVVSGSILVSLFLYIATVNPQSISRLQTLTIFASVLAGTFVITFLVWITQYTEFMDGVQLIILGNAVVVLTGEWGSKVLPHLSSISPLVFALFLGVLGLFILYNKKSKIQLDIVNAGRFDFKAGELRSSANRIQLATVFDGYHYLFGFIIVLFLGSWLRKLIQTPSASFLHWVSIETWHSKLFIYLFCVCWLIYKKARFELTPEAIQRFLQQRNSFLENVQDWKQANSHLRLKFIKGMLMDFVFETAIIVSLVAFTSAVFQASDQVAFEYVLYLTTLAALSIYLLLSTARQIGAAFFQGNTSVIMSLPLPVEDDDDLGWVKRTYNSIRVKYGILGFLVLVAGVLQFFDYLFRIFKWLWKMIF